MPTSPSRPTDDELVNYLHGLLAPDSVAKIERWIENNTEADSLLSSLAASDEFTSLFPKVLDVELPANERVDRIVENATLAIEQAITVFAPLPSPGSGTPPS